MFVQTPCRVIFYDTYLARWSSFRRPCVASSLAAKESGQWDQEANEKTTRVQGICKSCRPFCQLHGSFFWPLRRYFEGGLQVGDRGRQLQGSGEAGSCREVSRVFFLEGVSFRLEEKRGSEKIWRRDLLAERGRTEEGGAYRGVEGVGARGDNRGKGICSQKRQAVTKRKRN